MRSILSRLTSHVSRVLASLSAVLASVSRVLVCSRSRRLSRLARTARARTLGAYAVAAGYFPHRFHVRNVSGPCGASRIRYADGGAPPRADAFRARRPAPAVAPCEPLARTVPEPLAFRVPTWAGHVT